MHVARDGYILFNSYLRILLGGGGGGGYIQTVSQLIAIPTCIRTCRDGYMHTIHTYTPSVVKFTVATSLYTTGSLEVNPNNSTW